MSVTLTGSAFRVWLLASGWSRVQGAVDQFFRETDDKYVYVVVHLEDGSWSVTADLGYSELYTRCDLMAQAAHINTIVAWVDEAQDSNPCTQLSWKESA